MKRETGMVLGILGLLMACGGGQVRREFSKPPKWYDEPPKGCGVGSAVLRSIRQAARDGAVASARMDLGRSLETTVQGMIKRYLQEGESGLMQDFSEERITSVVRDVTETTLQGVRVVRTESTDNEFFALVCLDPETFSDAFGRMGQLSQKQREALRKRAEAEFQDLDKQLEQLRQRE